MRTLIIAIGLLLAGFGNSAKATASRAHFSAVNAIPSPANPPANFKHAYTKVNGIDIHYVVGGTGEPLVLLHGFGQNWYMWNRLLPELSKHFTVIAPDLPGLIQ